MPFRDVVGHRKLVELLSRSAARGTLPPSLIFSGPRGVGKRLTAEALAQALNCLHPRQLPSSDSFEFDACGECTACSRIARGIHPDVLFLEPGDSGSIKIEAVRDMIDRAPYRPFEGRRRVLAIDDADAMVVHAQNALLKTLEEPPPSSVFILVTAQADALLPTVQSRCPRLRFRPLATEEVAAALVGRGRSEREAQAAAATAHGSIGRALETSADDFVQAQDIAARVLIQAAASQDPRRRLEAAKDLLAKTGVGSAADRDRLASHLKAVASLLRDVALLSTSADVRGLANPEAAPVLEKLTMFRGERGLHAFDSVERALAALDRNAGVKTVADWVVLQL